MLLISMNPSAFPPLPVSSANTTTRSDTFSLPMPSAKRPKLSLQTSALPSAHYGTAGSNTGNARLVPMNTTAATPTALNTFNNTFELSIRPSPVATTESPSLTTSKPPNSKSFSRLTKRQLPYELNLPLDVRPILKNSLLPLEVRRGSLSGLAAASNSSPLSANTSRKVFFPEPKRVKFAPSEEEVVNKVYVLRDIDVRSSSSLSSDDDDDDDDAAASSSSSNSDGSEEDNGHAIMDQEGDDSEREAPLSERLSQRTAENVDEIQRGRSESRQSKRHRGCGGAARETTKTRKRRRWEWTLSTAEDDFETIEHHHNHHHYHSNDESHMTTVSTSEQQNQETQPPPQTPTPTPKPHDTSAMTSTRPSLSVSAPSEAITKAEAGESKKTTTSVVVVAVEEVLSTPTTPDNERSSGAGE